jgi:MFS family permease
MLSGSVAGGLVAQYTNLGVPYLVRSAALVVTFLVALRAMHDVGFTPQPSRSPLQDVRRVVRSSLRYGLGNPAVRWVMLAELFLGGVAIYAYYALQPYLLELWGDEQAYGIAGLSVAIFAGAQILGGVIAPHVRGWFRRRTSVLLVGTLAVSVLLALLGVTRSFWVAVVLLVAQGLVFAAIVPIRQAYLNDLIPSEQRATVLSFDMLLDSAGGIVWQPALGRVAEIRGYPASYLVSGGIQLLALPFLALARGQDHPADAAAAEPAAEPAT